MSKWALACLKCNPKNLFVPKFIYIYIYIYIYINRIWHWITYKGLLCYKIQPSNNLPPPSPFLAPSTPLNVLPPLLLFLLLFPLSSSFTFLFSYSYSNLFSSPPFVLFLLCLPPSLPFTFLLLLLPLFFFSLLLFPVVILRLLYTHIINMLIYTYTYICRMNHNDTTIKDEQRL